jgi:hypothetical protein
MRRLAMVGAAAMATLGWGPAAKAQNLILRGVQQHPTGQRLADDAAVALAAGERLLLLRRGAGTRLVCGPYRGPLGAARNTCPEAAISESRVRVAAQRGRGGFDSLFDILTAYGQAEPINFCVNPDAFLTDHDFGEAVSRVEFGSGRDRVRTRWPSGQTNFRLRPHVRPRDNMLVTVTYAGQPLRFRLRIMPASLEPNTRVRLEEEAMTVADMLHALGCTHQEDQWLHHLWMFTTQERPFVLFNP